MCVLGSVPKNLFFHRSVLEIALHFTAATGKNFPELLSGELVTMIQGPSLTRMDKVLIITTT